MQYTQEQLVERNESGFFNAIKELVNEIKKRDNFVVVFHHDADGSASGAIAIKALEREGKKVSSLCLKQLYKENIPQIRALGENYLFVDFGSGQLDYLVEEFGEDFFVLDHHQPILVNGVMPVCKWQVNPLLFGINGGTEISGSGVTFFFAFELNKNNFDLSVLAIVGALGDMQDANSTCALIGLNRKILDIGKEHKLIEVKKDLRLYGRISRPLVSFLTFSSSPVLPGLTANEDNVKAFLAGLDIPLRDSYTEKWLTYNDLTFEQQRELTSALLVLLLDNNTPEWKISELIGEVYTFLKENPSSPLCDGKEFSTMLNACSRNKHSEIALAVCKGDRNEGYSKAVALMDEHRENLRRGIEFIKQRGIEEKSSFYFFDAGEVIDESIVGVIAGMLYGSIISETKPIIALARNKDGTTKASGRGTSALVRRGLNIGGALKEISQIIPGVEGGGHCLHPDTLVQKSNGEICEIKNILKNDFVVSRKDSFLVNSLCNKTFISSKKRIVSLKTKNTNIIVSEDHRLFKYENFGIVEVKAKDLKEKDFILGVKKIPFVGKDIKVLNNPFVYLTDRGIKFLRNKRIDLNLSKSQLSLRVPSFKDKTYTLLDLESFRSHRIIESSLLEYISILQISKKYFYNKFIKRKLACNTKILNKEIAWLVGYIQGDGNIGKKRIECKEPDDKILSKFKKSIFTNFFLSSVLVDMKTYKKIRVYSADLCRFFKSNFPESCELTGNLRVPTKIMISKNKILASYISGLFDAEACVYNRFIVIRMIDEYLLKTIQLLLLRFGIKSNFREVKLKKVPNYNSKKSFLLDITDFESLMLFQKDIGFAKNGKKNVLLKKILKKQLKKKRNSMLFSPITYGFMRKFSKENNIPKHIFDYGVVYKRANSKRMNYVTLNKHFINPILRSKKDLNANVIQKVNWLNKIVNSEGLTFYEIKTKTNLGEKNAFIDLSVPKTKNFMANGLIVHNSIAAGAKIPSEKLDEVLNLLEEKFKEQLGL